jgi:fructokinase
MNHIYAVGETILDIIFKDGQPMAARPGGSSFNASITLGRLGAPVTLISEMGNDRVGDMIQEFLKENGVNSRYVCRYETGQSAIALAFLNKRSDAEYQFYKDYPHQRLNIEFPDFKSNDLLLFGSFYALNPGIRPRVKELLMKAKAAGVTVVYDPNFRSSHLAERDQLLDVILENMEFATLVRASDEDLLNVFGVGDPREAWKRMGSRSTALICTANAHEVHLITSNLELRVEVEKIEPLSTIGAGDTFNAGLLYGISLGGYTREQLENLERDHWERLIRRAISFSREVCLSYDNYLPVEVAERVKRESQNEKSKTW